MRRAHVNEHDRPFVIYVLVDDAGRARYVGRTCSLTSRLGAHRRRFRWYRSFIVAADVVGIADARVAERAWIHAFIASGVALENDRMIDRQIIDGNVYDLRKSSVGTSNAPPVDATHPPADVRALHGRLTGLRTSSRSLPRASFDASEPT